MKLRCLLGKHRVLLDYSQCVQPEPNVIVGPVLRRCGDCPKILDGLSPNVGDRARKEDMPPLMTLEERTFWSVTGAVPERLAGRSPR